MRLHNSTHLDTARLERLMLAAIEGWPRDGLDVRVRYSRGAEFSGTCFYKAGKITINLGRRNSYPYAIRTGIARAESDRRHWWREIYSVHVADAYQLALFIFLHEFYHWLVRKARRNIRQKESRCDRFATRALVELFQAPVFDAKGRPVPREEWDFQDLDGFVAAARGRPRRVLPPRPRAARQPVPAVPLPPPKDADGQLLFDWGFLHPSHRV
jgi:hypothetical protein